MGALEHREASLNWQNAKLKFVNEVMEEIEQSNGFFKLKHCIKVQILNFEFIFELKFLRTEKSSNFELYFFFQIQKIKIF